MGNSASSLITLHWTDEKLEDRIFLADLYKWFPRIERLRHQIFLGNVVDLAPRPDGSLPWALRTGCSEERKPPMFASELGGPELLRHVVELILDRCKSHHEPVIERELRKALYSEDYEQQFRRPRYSRRLITDGRSTEAKDLSGLLMLLETIVDVGRCLGSFGPETQVPMRWDIERFYDTHQKEIRRLADPKQALRLLRIADLVHSQKMLGDFFFQIYATYKTLFPGYVSNHREFQERYGTRYDLTARLCQKIYAGHQQFEKRQRDREGTLEKLFHDARSSTSQSYSRPPMVRNATTGTHIHHTCQKAPQTVIVVSPAAFEALERSAILKYPRDSRANTPLSQAEYLMVEVKSVVPLQTDGRYMEYMSEYPTGTCAGCSSEYPSSRMQDRDYNFAESIAFSEYAKRHAEQMLREEKRVGQTWEDEADSYYPSRDYPPASPRRRLQQIGY